MASKEPIPQPDRIYLSPEECRERWGSFFSAPVQLSIPDWHMEILEERIADYCENGVHMTPWEDFEKELFEMLMKG
ncbi:MAG TPA: addiction module protein [Pyrinomonadaceae bacterium]|nr:addiction module protein [Pyrinomonadaceae bacterium]